jgi:hypothetical protein
MVILCHAVKNWKVTKTNKKWETRKTNIKEKQHHHQRVTQPARSKYSFSHSWITSNTFTKDWIEANLTGQHALITNSNRFSSIFRTFMSFPQLYCNPSQIFCDAHGFCLLQVTSSIQTTWHSLLATFNQSWIIRKLTLLVSCSQTVIHSAIKTVTCSCCTKFLWHTSRPDILFLHYCMFWLQNPTQEWLTYPKLSGEITWKEVQKKL